VFKEAKQSYNKQFGLTKRSFKDKSIGQSPNKQGDAATTYDNQKEITHFLLSTTEVM